MNYNNLLYFSVLAQTEHYTIAAARLGISQPSLSSAIHNLENELGGVNLFEKVGRNVRLTDEGRAVLQAERERLKEILEYQIKDIDSLKLHEGEEEELIDKKVKIKNSEKIVKNSEFVFKESASLSILSPPLSVPLSVSLRPKVQWPTAEPGQALTVP